jgi:hypothetical protein
VSCFPWHTQARPNALGYATWKRGLPTQLGLRAVPVLVNYGCCVTATGMVRPPYSTSVVVQKIRARLCFVFFLVFGIKFQPRPEGTTDAARLALSQMVEELLRGSGCSSSSLTSSVSVFAASACAESQQHSLGAKETVATLCALELQGPS